MIKRALRAVMADFKLHLLSIFSVSVAFVCLSATLLVSVNIDAVREKWAENGRASVYLVPDVQPKRIQTIRQALLSSEGVTEVKYVSSEQARAEIMESSTDEALAGLPADAFPASLEVSLVDEKATSRIERLGQQLEELAAVETVETYAAWGERLDRLLAGGITVALILLAVVLAAVVSVVGSTMRLALSRRSREVEVLKMVGATDSYVRGPFVLEGAMQGGAGACLAILLCGLLYLVIKDAFHGALGTLLGASPQFLSIAICAGLVVLGIVLGATSALASLKRLLGSQA